MTDKKTLTLDISKWRCGLDSDNAIGKGPTKLLNKEGYMCCLGQFALQLGYSKTDLLEKSFPRELQNAGQYLLYAPSGDTLHNSGFSVLAVYINDSKICTPKQKVNLLKELCADYDITLKVVNEHLLEVE